MCLISEKKKKKIKEKHREIDKNYGKLKEDNAYLQQNIEWFKQNFFNCTELGKFRLAEQQIEYLAE